MTDKQRAWVYGKIDILSRKIESKGVANLTDDDWQSIIDFIAKCVEQAKSSGAEVRKMLFDFIEPYDREVN